MSSSSISPTLGSESTGSPPPPRRWLGLSILLLAAVMELLDTTIVNVAIPSVESDLHATPAEIQWIVASYILAFAVLLITGGRLGDAFGRRRTFLAGVGGFTVMSLAAGLAQSADQLVAARVGQGIFAAVMIPQVLASIRATFPVGEHAKAYGLYGAFVGLATVSGPLLGGLIVDADLFGLSWRPIFLVNVPIGIAAAIGALVYLPESTSPEKERFDLVGVGLLTAALLLVIHPLVQGAAEPWTIGRCLTLLAAVPVLLVFLAYERYRTQRVLTPLLPLRLFRVPGFSGGFLVALVFFAGVAGFFLALTITLQRDLGLTPIQTGLAFLPWSLGIFIASGIAVNTVAKLGRGLIIAGTLLMSAGMGVMYWVVRGSGHTLTASDLIVGLALCGLGMGAVAPTLIDVILRGVGHSDAGAASGVLNSALQVGGAVGVALLGTMFFRHQPGPPLTGNDQLPGMQAVLLALTISYAVSAAMAALLLPAKSSGQPERGTSDTNPFNGPSSSTDQRRSKCPT